MDRVKSYSQILELIVKRHGQFQPANGNIQTYAVCDHKSGNFMVIDSGWNEKNRRIYDVVIHFRVQDKTVYVERDNTDAEVVRELLEAGVEKEVIILAYNALPYQKIVNLVAA